MTTRPTCSAQYDLLADAVRQALDMDLIYRILEGKA